MQLIEEDQKNLKLKCVFKQGKHIKLQYFPNSMG
jgi:hypothetical protein